MAISLVDTHCHIHSSDYGLDPDQTIKEARLTGVNQLICVGTNLDDSERAVNFVSDKNSVWASIGIHPHETKSYNKSKAKLAEFARLVSRKRVVAIGECGLDYYYNLSPKADQVAVFEYQLEVAKKHNLPVIFHIRNAFDDFWPIIDNFPGIRGVVHSFTAGPKILDGVISRGLLVGVNGIMTFTRDQTQLAAAKLIPADKLLLETDAPFLSPIPFRGKVNQPKYITATAEFLAKLRGESVSQLAKQTSENATKLFKL